MNKINVILNDYYSFPDIRFKSLKYLNYICGRKIILDILNGHPIVNQIKVFVTGGACHFSNTYCCDYYFNIDNKFQDFGAYLCGLNSKWDIDSNTLILNSSCPPAYLTRVLDYIGKYDQNFDGILFGPGFSSIGRKLFFIPVFYPHIQSYCFLLSKKDINDVVNFLNKVTHKYSNQSFIKKRNLIIDFEVALSKYYINNKNGISWLGPSNIIRHINSSSFRAPIIIDSRYSI